MGISVDHGVVETLTSQVGCVCECPEHYRKLSAADVTGVVAFPVTHLATWVTLLPCSEMHSGRQCRPDAGLDWERSESQSVLMEGEYCPLAQGDTYEGFGRSIAEMCKNWM